MPTLYDRIIDEAENLAQTRQLPPHATRAEIAEAVSKAVEEYFHPNSTYAALAEASYNRYALLQLAS